MTRTPSNERFTLITASAESRRDRFAKDVAAGLTASPKRLSCCYFYDRLGSRLFEAICELPEYYLTRAETAILQTHADDIAELFSGTTDVIELGSGTAVKTRLLIDAFLGRQPTLRYVPVDICRTVLEESSRILLDAYPSLEILAIAGEYNDAFEHLRSTTERPKLILWLGSNIGNFDRTEAAHFLHGIGSTMTSADRILVGVDLRKDRSTLEAAYDDACGVTAAFNRNILARINRELGGHFDLKAFQHRAVYNEAEGRIEMYLVSSGAQQVTFDSLRVSLAAGEAIHTENSYKYSQTEIDELTQAAGLQRLQSWLDPDKFFSVVLLARR